jgi:hypothetical protein
MDAPASRASAAAAISSGVHGTLGFSPHIMYSLTRASMMTFFFAMG